MGIRFVSAFLIAATVLLATLPAKAQVVTKEDVPGITNFKRVETTVACSGAITTDAVPKIKQFGFKSIINLRESTEAGANVEAEEAAAKDAGIQYFHIPMNAQTPTPEVADKFLEVITTPGVEPAFIHCASGNRAAALWLIKRLVVDHWKADEALDEAADLGLTNPKLLQWSLHYADAHQKDAHIPGATGPATQQ
jgi:uncharacterized protein (TIGR01244 family)